MLSILELGIKQFPIKVYQGVVPNQGKSELGIKNFPISVSRGAPQPGGEFSVSELTLV